MADTDDAPNVADLLREVGELADQCRAVFAQVKRLGQLETLVRSLFARLDQLETVVRSLADRVLTLANANEHGTEAILLARQKLTEIYDQREYVRAGLDEVRREILSVSKDVEHVEKVTREATGAHPLVQIEPDRPTAVKVIEAFAKLPRVTQVLIIIALLAAGIGGWVWKLAEH